MQAFCGVHYPHDVCYSHNDCYSHMQFYQVGLCLINII